jgi:glucokinase
MARTLVDEAATELAIHVAILANALDPTLVVLGGGLGCAMGRYWSSFRAALPRHTFGPHMRRLRVRRAQLGTMAGTIGAALCALEAPWR